MTLYGLPPEIPKECFEYAKMLQDFTEQLTGVVPFVRVRKSTRDPRNSIEFQYQSKEYPPNDAS